MIFLYTWLYTSHKRFRKCIKKKIAFYKNKNKKIICQTPTKAVENSFATMHSSLYGIISQNKCVLQVCCCMRNRQKILVLVVTSLLFLNWQVTQKITPLWLRRDKNWNVKHYPKVIFKINLKKNISWQWNASTNFQSMLSLLLNTFISGNKSFIVMKQLGQA